MAIPHTRPRAIIRDPRILHAEPILAGTRIPVRTVVQLMRLHGNVSTVQHELPTLTVSDISAALDYYTTHRDEIDRWIAFDNADADEPL